MISRLITSIVFAASLVASAQAADNAVIVTPGTGVTLRSKDVGSGVQSMIQIPGDTSGNPLATAPGTGNAVFALPIQGVASGVAVPISAASLPLPTSAATAANQSSQITQETAINTLLGTVASAASCSAASSSTLIECAYAQYTAMTSSIPAGNALIGKFGIDQTTPGTTNNITLSPLPAAARNFPGCTVGTSTTPCLSASTAVNFLQIENTTATANNYVSCAFGVSAVLNAKTAVLLAPGQSASWGPNTGGVPTGALNCIASNASTPLYLEWD